MSQPQRNLVIGIDGGGSKTTAIVADEAGAVLGRGSAGASNYQAIGAEQAFAALEAAIAEACAQAGLDVDAPHAMCLGLAGAGRAEDMALFSRWTRKRWPSAIATVVNDAELVLAAGTPEGWGLAVICGTGSIAIGQDRHGRTARAGGWGYLFGDEGSGYALGVAALRAVAHAADGRGPHTTLTEAILAHWELDEPMALIKHVYQSKPSNAEIAAVAGLVHTAALTGDPVACDLMNQASDELAAAAASVARQLAFDGSIPCALAGGLFTNVPLLTNSIMHAAAHRGLTLTPLIVVAEPALGAIQIALRGLNERDGRCLVTYKQG